MAQLRIRILWYPTSGKGSVVELEIVCQILEQTLRITGNVRESHSDTLRGGQLKVDTEFHFYSAKS